MPTWQTVDTHGTLETNMSNKIIIKILIINWKFHVND